MYCKKSPWTPLNYDLVIDLVEPETRIFGCGSAIAKLVNKSINFTNFFWKYILNILIFFQTKVPNDEVFEYCLEEENESNLVVCTTRSSSRPTTSSISSTNSSNKKRKRNAWTDWLFPDPVLVPVNIWKTKPEESWELP